MLLHLFSNKFCCFVILFHLLIILLNIVNSSHLSVLFPVASKAFDLEPGVRLDLDSRIGESRKYNKMTAI